MKDWERNMGQMREGDKVTEGITEGTKMLEN
jgi:hypothetical protein